jgi:hypothetical protein
MVVAVAEDSVCKISLQIRQGYVSNRAALQPKMCPSTLTLGAAMTRAARWVAGLLIVIAALVALHAEFPRIIHEPGLWDFGSFMASGRAASEGLNPYGVYPLTLRVELPGFESWNPNLNPPISAPLFHAFDVADPYVTYQVWR